MTRLFSDGAEGGDVLFWYPGSAIVSSAKKRSGAYSYYINDFGASLIKVFPSALSECYYRFAYYLDGLDSHGSYRIVSLRNSGGTEMCYLTTSGASIYAYVPGLYGGSTGYALSTGLWHLFEIHDKIDASGEFTVKYDGLTIADYSGDTRVSGLTTVSYVLHNKYNATSPIYFDDIALNDTNGAVDNSWCGDEHYEMLMPNDNGDTNDWTGSDGDKVNNYLLVDERPPNTSDYVYSNTSLEQDMYNVGDFDPTGKIVTRIWAECRAEDESASANQIKIGFKTGGTVYLSASGTALASNYMRVVGDEALVNPDDSATWEEADLDAIQFVVERE